MSVTSPGLINVAGSMASAVFVPMQWLICVAGSSETPKFRCMNRACRLFEFGDAVVGIAAVFGPVDLFVQDTADRLAAPFHRSRRFRSRAVAVRDVRRVPSVLPA